MSDGPKIVLCLVLAVPSLALAQSRPTPQKPGKPLPTSGAKGAAVEPIDPSVFPKRIDSPGGAIHVSGDGKDDGSGSEASPYRTIRRALSDGHPFIIVHAGTYSEGGDDEVAIVLDREGSLILAAKGAKPVLKPASPAQKIGVAVRANHVQWIGISLEGFESCGVSLGVEGKAVSDIVLADFGIAMPKGGDGIAAYPRGEPFVVDGLLVESVRIKGADIGFSIGSGPARRLALRDVTIANRGKRGSNSGLDGIAVESGAEILIDGAEVSGTEGDGIDLKAKRVAVLDVHVHHTGGNGIKLWEGGEVVNALVHDTGSDGAIIFVHGGEGVRYRVANATVAFHNRGGAASYVLTCGYDDPKDPIDLELVNVLFAKNTGGIVLSAGTKATFTGCAFVGSGPRIVDWKWDGSQCQSVEEKDGLEGLARAGKVDGGFVAHDAPLFVEDAPRTLDGFKLSPKCALVDAGRVVAPLPSTDLIGAPRVTGKRPDIGALERK